MPSARCWKTAARRQTGSRPGDLPREARMVVLSELPEIDLSGTREPDQKNWWDSSSQQWASFLRNREEQVFLVLALLIGAIVGMVVVAFILLTERFGARLYPAGGAAWRRLFVPVAGSAVMGYLLYRFFPDARGSGVPQTKAALYARGGRISLGTVIGKFFCTSTTLACGIPLGREGPAVQVGAGIASVLGRKLGLRPENVKALIPVGAAAAVAAAFNTPLAAVLFALEEVVGDMHAPVLGRWCWPRPPPGRCFDCCLAMIRCSRCRSINWCIRGNWEFTRYSELPAVSF